MCWPTMLHILPDVSVHEILRQETLPFQAAAGIFYISGSNLSKILSLTSECGEHCPGLGCIVGETQIC